MLMRLSAITPSPTQRFIPAVAFVSATIEPVSPLGHADASLASGPPFLAVAEPALLLLASAPAALGGAIGDADALDALGFGRGLVLGGIEGGVRRHQVGASAERRLVGFDGRNQQVRSWAADRRPRSRSRSGFRLPAASPSCRIRWACRTCPCGISVRPRLWLLGWRCAKASYTAVTISSSAKTRSAASSNYREDRSLFGNQAIAEAELAPPHLNHACFPRFFEAARSRRSKS